MTADKDEMDMHIRDKFQTVFWNPDAEPVRVMQQEMRAIFDKEDVRNAARLIKEKKALGMDCWSVKQFKNQNAAGDRICQDLADLLNRGEIPEYCREARICPLSKTGNPSVSVDDIRPITIQG